MPINEKLRAVVSYTTPGGNALSWTNNVDLTINDTSFGPQTYDIYVDKDRGGPSTLRDGYYQKTPKSLYELFREQHPTAIQRDGDTYNLRIAAGTAIVGSTLPAADLFSAEETNNAGINLTMGSLHAAIMNSYQSGLVTLTHDAIYKEVWQHSDGDYYTRQYDQRIDFKGCYGKMRLFIWALHASTKTVSLSIYNADHSLASDKIYLSGGQATNTVDLDIQKGQYGFIYVSYTKGSIDSKNNAFFMIKLSVMGGGITPALLISKKFNSTHTINIYNDGLILGYGGDAQNYTPAKGSSEWWNRDIPHMHVDTHHRVMTGGDAIMCTDVRQINIYNNGTIAGGGGSSAYRMVRVSSENRYTPGDGGAPYGRGGAIWSAFNARVSGGHIDPILYGKAATLINPGGVNAGGWGKRGRDLDANTSNHPGGFYYRGSADQVNYYGSGQYIGMHPRSTAIP